MVIFVVNSKVLDEEYGWITKFTQHGGYWLFCTVLPTGRFLLGLGSNSAGVELQWQSGRCIWPCL